MSTDSLTKLAMPKWGMSMTEGKLVEWLVEEGAEVNVGDDVAEVETEKINGIVEAPATGVLRRRLAQVGDVVPVGAMLGVIADPSVSDDDVDAFVANFQATFVPETAEEEGGPAAETVVLDGRRVRYVKQGVGGETVILLHGFGGDLNNWLFNIESLGRRRTVYAVDLPGHGGSTKEVQAGDLDEYAQVVADFLAAMGVERAHLVGHSLGGAVAIAFAAADPDKAASLILIASAGLGAEINAEYIEGFTAADTRRELKPYLELLFADSSLVTRQLVDDVLKYKRLDGVEQALRTVAARLFPEGRQASVLAPKLAELSLPVLVIWGSDDRIIPSAHTDAVAGHARVVVLEKKGHSPHMEAAGEVNRLIEEFLGELQA